MARRTLVGVGGLLVLFHVWLLGSQAWEGQLAEPGLMLRWLVAIGLVGALAGLRRRGASLFWGRRAVAVWLLAALLHGPAAIGEHPAHDSPAIPEAIAALVQIAAASAIAGLGLALAATLARRPADPSPCGRPQPIRVHALGGLDPDRPSRFAPRPPPSRRPALR